MHNLARKLDHVFSLKTQAGVWNDIACSQKGLEKSGITIITVMEKKSTPGGEAWTCLLTKNDDYQVNTLRKRLDHCSPVDIGRFEWMKEIPIKVTTFIWRAK